MSINRQIAGVGLFLVALYLAFVVIEGVSSTFLLAFELVFHSRWGLDSRSHTQHDTTLGWVNRPNVNLPNMYGPGIALRTNSRSARGVKEFDEQVPAGSLRVICAGDSFTLGVGVDDDHPWCARLGAIDPRLETVNFGQAGYGVDQAYLLYRRERPHWRHDIVVFAFILDDLHRMTKPLFAVYPKPLLKPAGDSIVLTHVPVPRQGALASWVAFNSPIFARLRVVDLAGRLVARLGPEAGSTDTLNTTEARTLARLILDDVDRQAAAANATPVFVYLEQSLRPAPSFARDDWLRFLHDEMTRTNRLFLDLRPVFDSMLPSQRSMMFDSRWMGHYSVAGNQLVAERVYQAFRSDRRIGRRLTAPAAAASGGLQP